jgi:cytochrome c oxidase subunit 4
MTDNHSASHEAGTQRHRLEGPQKHIIVFVLSMVLTIIAFAAVASGDLNKMFVIFLLLGMAIVQVFAQLAFWMHMKDRGHLFPIIGIVGGAFVVVMLVALALLWTWW